VANRSRPNEDLYVYTGKNPDSVKPIIKAHVNPLVMWIWIGVVVVGFGTVLALIPNLKPGRVYVTQKLREEVEAVVRRGAVEVGGD
jgi:cytochrome c-type biogenesis protein CcmF